MNKPMTRVKIDAFGSNDTSDACSAYRRHARARTVDIGGRVRSVIRPINTGFSSRQLVPDGTLANDVVKGLWADSAQPYSAVRAREKERQGEARRPVHVWVNVNTGNPDSIIDLHDRALGSPSTALRLVAAGMACGGVANENGVRRAILALGQVVAKSSEKATHRWRLVPRDHRGTDRDRDDIREVAIPGDAAGHRSEPSSPAEQSVNSGPPLGRVSLDYAYGQGEQPGTQFRPAASACGLPSQEFDGARLRPGIGQNGRVGGPFVCSRVRQQPPQCISTYKQE